MSLFGRSRVRDRILLEFFAKPGTTAHVREMARRVNASAPTVGAELAELARLGVLQTNTIGRSLVYSVNEAPAVRVVAPDSFFVNRYLHYRHYEIRVCYETRRIF